MSQSIIEQYFSAWNRHDADALVSLFGDNAFYHDPNGTMRGADLAQYAMGLWEAFPDLRFEVMSQVEQGSNAFAVEWRMSGTNRGAFNGLPPTGKAIILNGADFIDLERDKIASVTGYFDSAAVPKQLGLQVLVQPDVLGPFSFGSSITAQSGSTKAPGAFSITTIWSTDEDGAEVRNRAREVSNTLLKAEGFIGLALARIGNRSITITAWEHPDQIAHAIARNTEHNTAMRRFWDTISDAGFTSVWVPERINPMYVRCPECRSMADYHRLEGACACGEQLPDPPPYF